ncbi:MAG: formylglycine-generating enzyme family protein [Psychrosphaera sp.]|nr:formylglycine-generating enzyme family protein [Psychrosphaera sp.]
MTTDLAEIDNQCRWKQRPPSSFPSRWACEWGFDDFGLWQSFKVKGILYKMRYICPGSFLMGSPADESERDNDETQHKVTLTQGYWLAETTVSQALWQAVMGNTPSRFQQDDNIDLPVENISWDDCQQFFEQLNSLIPGLALTLPTEAQWEYACRAGTQTPFTTGQQLTAEQANYNGHHPYNYGETGEYRKKTVAVDAFEPNAWGLLQMHGNVWEWCKDGMRDYSQQGEFDPVGDVDRPRRVVRGGSWFHDALNCRSAFRINIARVNASDDIGLRVAQV